MCTKLRQNGEILVPGKQALIRTPQGERMMRWGYDNGLALQTNARLETIKKKWFNKGYEKALMTVDSFWEGHKDKETEFNFRPGGGMIGVIYKKDHFLVVTEAAGNQVSRVHHRQPCMREVNKLLAA